LIELYERESVAMCVLMSWENLFSASIPYTSHLILYHDLLVVI